MPKKIKLKNLIEEVILCQDSKRVSEKEELIKKFDELKEKVKGENIEDLLKEVEKFVHQIFDEFPQFSRLFFRVGLRCEDEGLSEEAIFFYRLANLLSPSPKAINNLAVLYAEQGKEKEAIKILKEGIKKFPEEKVLKENLEILEGK